MKNLDFSIEGSGGMFGGGGGGDSDPNSLRSKATVKIIDLLGEGEIKGLVDGGKSIFLDDTPLLGNEGQLNFKGLTWDTRNGLPDQTYIPGFAMVEAETGVSTQVLQGVPVIRSINVPDLDALRVTVRVPALYQTDDDDGTAKRTSVQFRIEVQYNGGSWVDQFGIITIYGKCVGPYDLQKRVQLPKNPSGTSHPWNVRVTRITADSEDEKLMNDLYFASYTTILDGKFSYPNSALVAMAIDGEQFGQSVPNRRYEVFGRIIRVPVNYNPETRVYTGVWNGTFKWAWTDNPAWVFYDVLTNDRFGLGEYIDIAQVDKWSLYEIAQYCDVLVPDGYGGMEPRFTFNGVLSTQQEAYNALQSIASAFRGMAFWSSGSVMASQDRPQDPAILVTPANAVGGIFTYQSSALKARHTVAVVEWADPAARYDRAYEPVYNNEGILRYGYRETRITAVGCTSRSMAHRYGEWALLTELNETQVITYQAGMDHAGIRPGDLVAVQDPNIAMVEISGRITPGSTTTLINIDTPVTLTSGRTYTLSVILPDGSVVEKPVTITALATPLETLTLSSALPAVPLDGAIWLLAANDLKPQIFKVISIREVEPHIYEVSGTQHEEAKFDAVDYSADFDPAPVMEKPLLEPPLNLTVMESLTTTNNIPMVTLTLSWEQPKGWASPVAYTVTADTPDGHVSYGMVKSMSLVITNATQGAWTFRVCSLNVQGKPSLPAILEYTTGGWQGTSPPTVTDLHLVNATPGAEDEFYGRDVEVAWTNVFDEDTFLSDGTNPFFAYNTVKVYNQDTNDLLRTERRIQPNYTYTLDNNIKDNALHGNGPCRRVRITVSVSDVYNRTSAEEYLVAYNPPPARVVVKHVLASVGAIYCLWTRSEEADAAGALVWVQPEGTPFDPGAEPAYEGNDTVAVIAREPNQLLDVYIAIFDTFGKDGLDAAGPFTVYTSGLGFEDLDLDMQEYHDFVGDSLREAADVTNRLDLMLSQYDIAHYGDLEQIRTEIQATHNAITAEYQEDIIAYVGPGGALAGRVEELEIVTSTTLVNAINSLSVQLNEDYGFLADAITSLSGADEEGNIQTANFRMSLVSGPAGYSRIAFEARNGGLGPFRASSLFLDVPNDPDEPTRIVAKASEFIVVDDEDNILAVFGGDGKVLGARIPEIQTDMLAAGLITTAKLAAASVTANELAAGSVTADKIQAGAIKVGKIDAGAINTSSLIVDGVVITGKMAVDAVTSVWDTVNAGENPYNPQDTKTDISLNVSIPASTKVLLLASLIVYRTSGNAALNMIVRLRRNGLVLQEKLIIDDGSRSVSNFAFVDYPGAGFHTYDIQCYLNNGTGSLGPVTRGATNARSLVAMAAKR